MKNKNGFTMIELLAVIAILGIISTIAIAGIQGILNRTKVSYLDGQNKMVVLAGKSYYADHRSKLPKVIGPIHEVSLQTLIDLKYIDPVKDAKGRLCVSNGVKKSKVMVQKVSNEEYKYTGYLSCNGEEAGKNDTKPPVVSLTPSRTNGTSRVPVDVSLKVVDDVKVLSYRYIIYKDGSEYKDTGYKNYKGTVGIQLKENGTYSIKAYGYDTSGNRGEVVSGEYRVSIPVPNCNAITVGSNPNSFDWQGKNISIVVSKSDSNIESFTVKDRYYDNKNKRTTNKVLIKKTGDASRRFTLSENGEHFITVEAYNSVGGSCTKTIPNSYKVDKEKPRVTALEGNPERWVNYNFSLTGRTDEGYSGVNYWQYSYDQRNWITYANSAKNVFTTTPFSAERNQNVYIRVIDKVGNISGAKSSLIRIDKTRPTVWFTTNKDVYQSNSGINVYGACNDNSGGS